MFFKGFIYRWGIRIKNLGERMAFFLVAGIPVLRWACGPFITLGKWLSYSVLDSHRRDKARTCKSCTTCL